MDPKSFGAMLDRFGLSTPSTQGDYPSGIGAELESGAALAPSAYYHAAARVTHNSFEEREAFSPNQPRVTLGSIQKRAA